jgi:DNA-binding transcriptional MocR family regulator
MTRGLSYTGTFSKIMSAGMRLGWCVGPAKLIEDGEDEGRWRTSPFASNVAAEYAHPVILSSMFAN